MPRSKTRTLTTVVSTSALALLLGCANQLERTPGFLAMLDHAHEQASHVSISEYVSELVAGGGEYSFETFECGDGEQVRIRVKSPVQRKDGIAAVDTTEQHWFIAFACDEDEQPGPVSGDVLIDVISTGDVGEATVKAEIANGEGSCEVNFVATYDLITGVVKTAQGTLCDQAIDKNIEMKMPVFDSMVP